MNRIFILAFVVLCITLCFVQACSFNTMQTARQLEAGEWVLSGHIDEPGFVYIPRVSAQATYGLAGLADVSAHVGTTLVAGNAGVTARAYLTERIVPTLQLDVMLPLVDIPFSENNTFTIISLNPRITTAVKEGELFYGGVQSNILWGIVNPDQKDRDGQFASSVFGLLGGIDMAVGERFGVQVELSFSPLYFQNTQNWGVVGRGKRDDEMDTDGFPFLAQIGASFYYRSRPFSK